MASLGSENRVCTGSQSRSVYSETISASPTTGLMQLPEELLMPVLGMLDWDTTRHVIRLVNERFYRLSFDATLHHRVKVPGYWLPNRVSDLLSTQTFQDHLQVLELRSEDDVCEMYQVMFSQHITLAALSNIKCTAHDLSRKSQFEPSVFKAVTPSLSKVQVIGYLGNYYTQQLFATKSNMCDLIRAFPKLQMHLDHTFHEMELKYDVTQIFKLHPGKLHGTVKIRTEEFGIFEISIDLFMEHCLTDELRENTQLFYNSLKRNATAVSLTIPKELLSRALNGLERATDVELEVGNLETLEQPEQPEQVETAKSVIQPQSLIISNWMIAVLETRYYEELLVKKCSSLIDLTLVKCRVSRALLSALPRSLRRLTVSDCVYAEGSSLSESHLYLQSLNLTHVSTAMVFAIADALPVQTPITNLSLELRDSVSTDGPLVASLLRRCELLSTLKLTDNCFAVDTQFPLSLQYASITFDLSSILKLDLQTSVEISRRLLLSPALTKLTLTFNIHSDHIPEATAEAAVRLLLQQALNSSRRLSKLNMCFGGLFKYHLAMCASHMIETTLNEQSRPYRKDGANAYMMVPLYLC